MRCDEIDCAFLCRYMQRKYYNTNKETTTDTTMKETEEGGFST